VWDKNWPGNYRFADQTKLDHYKFIARLAKKYHPEDEPTASERNKKYVAWGNIVKP
jgi:hypothetical protein